MIKECCSVAVRRSHRSRRVADGLLMGAGAAHPVTYDRSHRNLRGSGHHRNQYRRFQPASAHFSSATAVGFAMTDVGSTMIFGGVHLAGRGG